MQEVSGISEVARIVVAIRESVRKQFDRRDDRDLRRVGDYEKVEPQDENRTVLGIPGFYPDRIAGGDRDHSHLGGHASACLIAREGQSTKNPVPEQSQTATALLVDVSG